MGDTALLTQTSGHRMDMVVPTEESLLCSGDRLKLWKGCAAVYSPSAASSLPPRLTFPP